ncbi:MAG: hypothetical protein AB4352_02730 [Hormoscilla sp.]
MTITGSYVMAIAVMEIIDHLTLQRASRNHNTAITAISRETAHT